MSEWLNAELFTAVVIFYLINAVPSAMFGIALARRAGRPWWHGVLPAFLLPWLGLLFLSGQPAGKPYVTGPARYSMIMLFVAVSMTYFLASAFMDPRSNYMSRNPHPPIASINRSLDLANINDQTPVVIRYFRWL